MQQSWASDKVLSGCFSYRRSQSFQIHLHSWQYQLKVQVIVIHWLGSAGVLLQPECNILLSAEFALAAYEEMVQQNKQVNSANQQCEFYLFLSTAFIHKL